MAEIASAFVSLLPSAKGFGSKLQSQVGGEVDGTGKKLGSSFGKVFAASAAIIGGTAVIGGFLKDSIGEAREAQKVGAQTNAVLKSTGGIAGVTASQIGDLAAAISAKSGIDDEAIQSGENLLLTFTNIRNEAGKGNDIFNQTTQIVTDMSVALGQDMKSSAIQVGKALNDPIKGVTALQRVGVSFTAQQRDQIKAMVDSGHAMKAQKLILGELNKEFGGAAAAQATAGDKLKVAFGNLQETIGTALLPVVDRVATVLSSKVIPAISGFVTGMQTGVGVGGQVAAVAKAIANNFGTIAPVLATITAGMVAYKVATAAAAAVTAIQAAGTVAATGATWSLNAALAANPIGVVVVALTALVAGLIVAFKKSETFRDIVNGAWRAIKAVVGPIVSWFANFIPATFRAIASAMKSTANGIKTVVTAAWHAIGAVTAAVWTAMKNTILLPLRLALAGIRGDTGQMKQIISAAWDYLKGITSRAWDAIKSAVSKGAAQVVTFIHGIPSKILSLAGTFLSAGKSLGSKVISGIMDGLRSAGGFVSDLASSIKNAVNSALHLPFTIHGPGPLPDFTIPAFARGTSFAPGGLALVGERGPELVNLPRGSQVIPNNKLRSGGSALSDDAVLAELRAIRQAVGLQGREFGRELNGAVASGQRRRIA